MICIFDLMGASAIGGAMDRDYILFYAIRAGIVRDKREINTSQGDPGSEDTCVQD